MKLIRWNDLMSQYRRRRLDNAGYWSKMMYASHVCAGAAKDESDLCFGGPPSAAINTYCEKNSWRAAANITSNIRGCNVTPNLALIQG